MTNFAKTKWCKKAEKWLKHWHIGTQLRVLSESFLMSTNMTGFGWKSLHPRALDESSVSFGRVKNHKETMQQTTLQCIYTISFKLYANHMLIWPSNCATKGDTINQQMNQEYVCFYEEANYAMFEDHELDMIIFHKVYVNWKKRIISFMFRKLEHIVHYVYENIY